MTLIIKTNLKDMFIYFKKVKFFRSLKPLKHQLEKPV